MKNTWEFEFGVVLGKIDLVDNLFGWWSSWGLTTFADLLLGAGWESFWNLKGEETISWKTSEGIQNSPSSRFGGQSAMGNFTIEKEKQRVRRQC